MKILFLVENYHGFYTKYLLEHPGLSEKTYEKQCQELFARSFYQSDSYAHSINRLGYEAYQVVMDCKPLQRKWAEENNFTVIPQWLSHKPWRWYWTKILHKPDFYYNNTYRITLEQIKRIKPDVLYVFSGVPVNKLFLSCARQYARYIICQWACPILKNYPYGSYDLIITSTGALVDYFKREGINVEYLPHAFDDRILSKINTERPREGIVFIGSVLSDIHKERIVFLEQLARCIDFDFYGIGINSLSEKSPLRKKFKGEAYGLDMYDIYSRSKIAIHIHEQITGDFLGAKRPFEVTGSGAMLVTDAKKDLNNFFRIGKEVVDYVDTSDCLTKLRYYMEHEDERASIALAGQKRTLEDHTFKVRAKVLMDIIRQNLK